MLLSRLIEKPVVVSSTTRGVCLGIGVSLKNYAVKYLLCSSAPNRDKIDFCVNVSAIEKIENAVFLRRLRPVFPKNCAQITKDLPVFSYDGAFLGSLLDIEIQNFTAIRLITSKKNYPITALAACSDAVILRKEQPFPLGQRVPSPFVSNVNGKKEQLVTKQLLRDAIEKKSLVKLTLSLPPFNVFFTSVSRQIKD